ncbi:MAG: hypothetical protein IKB46_00635 [Paludibacteraceae bacterium]|nr:hypothetical protein [Paludibacteraceae bacterium]
MVKHKISQREILSQLPLAGNTISYFPKDMANWCVLVYVVSLCIVSIFFNGFIMPWWLWAFGIISVVLFFQGSNYFTKIWYNISERSFSCRLFLWAFFIRAIYALFIYYFNYEHYGTYYESQEGDITWYVPSALDMMKQLSKGRWNEVIQIWLGYGIDISDMGYVIYLSFLYLFSDSISDVVLPLILKAIYGAITCVMMYHIAERHFGEHVGRMTGIFCMLQFNMIWWCGSMMKETEMVFIMVWYIHEMDRVLSKGNFKLQNLSGAIILGLLLFTFRGALGLVAFGAMFLAILLSDSKAVSFATKIVAGVLVALVLGISYGDDIMDLVQDTRSKIEGGDYQTTNMEWRTERKEGNQFAKYASAAVFAPLIFTIPFPNMVYTYQSQEMQMMVSGGNFEKNILSFFVILVMFIFLFSGEWRKHVFPIAMLIGYLLALVFSVFAQSGRFHLPAIPLELMFAAYGISILYKDKTYKRWFNYALAIEVVACIAWAWFKLAGRGWI